MPWSPGPTDSGGHPCAQLTLGEVVATPAEQRALALLVAYLTVAYAWTPGRGVETRSRWRSSAALHMLRGVGSSRACGGLGIHSVADPLIAHWQYFPGASALWRPWDEGCQNPFT